MQNPMPPVDTPDKAFHDGNPLTGELGTIVTALFMNNVQSAIRNIQAEVISVLADAGITVDPNKTDQLLAALKATFATNTNVNGRVPVTRRVNSKALSADITLTAGDVGALPVAGTAVAATKLATARKIAGVPFDGTADIALTAENVGLVKQASLDDTTGGSLVINGGHGLGANARPRAAGATGGAAGCGFFSYQANHVDNPFGGTGASGIHVQEAGTYGWDLLGRNGGGIDLRLRQVSNGVASAWSALWTSANLANPMTTDTAQTVPGVKTFINYPRANGYHIRTNEATPRDVSYWRGLPADESKTELFANIGSLFLRSPTDAYITVNCGYTGTSWYKTNASNASHILSLTSNGLTVSSSPAGNTNAVVTTNPVLIRDVNAVVDASGYYKTPNSTEITPVTASEIAGLPQLFPGAVAPTGWLKCNGQSFDKALYPVLASRYPSGVLPDLRGEFVRGWDDGRGVDAGRALLSAQGDAIRNITGHLNPGGNGAYGDGALFKYDVGRQSSSGGANSDSALFTFDASRVVPTAEENRPRNIAFNYIVRAA